MIQYIEYYVTKQNWYDTYTINLCVLPPGTYRNRHWFNIECLELQTRSRVFLFASERRLYFSTCRWINCEGLISVGADVDYTRLWMLLSRWMHFTLPSLFNQVYGGILNGGYAQFVGARFYWLFCPKLILKRLSQRAQCVRMFRKFSRAIPISIKISDYRGHLSKVK